MLCSRWHKLSFLSCFTAEDGQQVFLNSLNVRILNASWGVLAAAPSIIRGRVLHRETLSLGEQVPSSLLLHSFFLQI